MSDGRPRLAVLISGRGLNLQAILDATVDGRIPADPVGVFSSRADAAGLERAGAAGVPAEAVPHDRFPTRGAFDGALADALERVRPDIVALAGFMRVLGDDFIRRFQGRMLNIHPSLLPKYRGLHTHRRALQAGDAVHGASVHFVTETLDGGPVIIQGEFSVRRDDTEDTLAHRVLEEVELRIFPQALSWMARGALSLEAGAFRLHGQRRDIPLTADDLEPDFR